MKKVMVSGYSRVNEKWTLVEKGVALFHGFGSDYEELNTGVANFSTAIVEWPDGRVEMVRADHVRFIASDQALTETSLVSEDETKPSHTSAATGGVTAHPVRVAWVRRHPDGAFTSEFLEDEVIEPSRKASMSWVLRNLVAHFSAIRLTSSSVSEAGGAM